MTTAEDPRETDIHPRRRTNLIGHREIEQQLLRAYQSGRMHHAWLLAGPRGIGKATLAYRLARFILQFPNPESALDRSTLYVPPEASAARRIVSRGHPDLLVLERQFDPKRERLKSEIVIEDARGASEFFSRTAGEGGWRICIVDSADDLNSASANSLLKILEEPPARCLFLLVSHQPGSLLRTIRSRSLRLDMRPLNGDETLAVVKEVYGGEGQDDSELARAAILSAGSPGRALELLANKGAEIFDSFRTSISERGGLQSAERFRLADRFSGRDGAEDFDIFCELFLDWMAGEARRFAGAGKGAALAGAHGDIAHSIRLTNALNLDRRQAILDAMSRLEEAIKAA
ncbi:MAG: DNA polymerase III subunit delta' [Rhizobiales bacterium]|nr:DNA polymerase III subunit delta' [Hyphomicrobiales bacterium]